jgi:hypothetical protein
VRSQSLTEDFESKNFDRSVFDGFLLAEPPKLLDSKFLSTRTWPVNVAEHYRIRKMSGMFHSERHVCVVWGNKTPSREVFFQSSFPFSR